MALVERVGLRFANSEVCTKLLLTTAYLATSALMALTLLTIIPSSSAVKVGRRPRLAFLLPRVPLAAVGLPTGGKDGERVEVEREAKEELLLGGSGGGTDSSYTDERDDALVLTGEVVRFLSRSVSGMIH